ncbi:MAG: AAA family ATPase [Cyclobacteriaceae bacterium]|jgi:predicted ATPase
MITNVFVENFKAIYKGKSLPLQPFTVFIGNNGTGKSSILEALRILQNCVATDLNQAFSEWGDLSKIRNYNALLPQLDTTESGFKKQSDPILFFIEAKHKDKAYQYRVAINLNLSGDYYVVENEELYCNEQPLFVANVIDNEGNGLAIFTKTKDGSATELRYTNNKLILGLGVSALMAQEFLDFREFVLRWQFLYLNAHEMGMPVQQNRLEKEIRLDYTGRNIAEYILWLRNQSPESFDSLIRKMLFVIPYIKDIQPNVIESFTRQVELLLQENSQKSKPLPGWLLSSGTLRVLALLAMFEAPKKPSVLFVDEVENGLDPRTIGMLINLIQDEFATNAMQVIVTSHSPYFLDLVPLTSIVVAEKDQEGSKFHVPANEEALNVWKEKFTPGKLYTMGKLTK